MKSLKIRKELPQLSTIVIKIGSRILTSTGNEKRVPFLIEDIATLNKTYRVVIVTSGAIASGMSVLGLKKRPAEIPFQQACASIGQPVIMQRYAQLFSEKGIVVGQVLLTWDDLRSKKRYLNLRNTLFKLMELKVIPIINENDSVGVEEIQFGNNDVLGAQVAILVNADLFVNLTDVGGLFDKNPHFDSSAKHIPVVSNISSSLKKMADDRKNEISVGGMTTKLKAIENLAKAGIYALIGDGLNHKLSEVLSDPNVATLFLPCDKKMSCKRNWIAFAGQPKGTIIVDEGAENAILKNGKSLLPVGIKNVTGNFKAGDNIDICSLNGEVIARGLVNYSSDEIRIIKNCKSTEIEKKLGTKKFDEVIHRDNLVIL
ncbi:MAG: glutamate 5-kinase [Chitinispirillaceae bacterium]|nr:glutamate 5-kinase [Chitinispirillaceae bacterium]